MAGLSTHILDTSTGKPAGNVKIELFEGDRSVPALTCTTNSDGRTDKPLIEAGQLKAGTYELHFHAGDYFRTNNPGRTNNSNRTISSDTNDDTTVPFLDIVVIRFGIGHTDQHYHVPLLLSPFGYSTYRGS